jgi:hypothetical protein
MGMSVIGPIWAMLLFVALVGAIVWSARQRLYSSLSWPEMLGSVLPGMIMVLSFYALALHMHASLGGWPKSIGEAGFPPALAKHASWTFWYFEAILLAVIFGGPIFLGLCSFISRLRRFLAHISLFGASFVLCFFLMLLGPSQFLYWWWD